MIKYCPNYTGELKQSGGVKFCSNCKGKYYILETQDPITKDKVKGCKDSLVL